MQQNHYQHNVQVIKVNSLIKIQVQFHALTSNVQDGQIQLTYKTVMMNVTIYQITNTNCTINMVNVKYVRLFMIMDNLIQV